MHETVPDALERAAGMDLPNGILRFLDRQERPTEFSWADVDDRSRRAAGALAHAGVRRGDRVAIVLPTSPTFFDAFLGAQRLGAVPVPLYPPVRLGRLDEYIARTTAMLTAVDAVTIVTDARVRRILGQVVAAYRPRLGLLDAEELRDGQPIAHATAPDDLAMVQFSSGTTTHPKAVGLTHAQILSNAHAVVARVLARNPLHSDTPAGGASWLPLYHDMGLIGCVLPAILGPGPLTLIPPEDFLAKPSRWLRAISRYRATISPAPNFAYALCAERIRDEELDGVDLSSWSMALNGAEPISTHTLDRFTSRFAPYGFDRRALMPVYGLSEASLAVTFTPTDRGPRILQVDPEALLRHEIVPMSGGRPLVSVGEPLQGMSVRIEGTGVGPIRVKGPSVMTGYLDREEQPFDDDGWLITGDLGFLWEGELFITGREKDIIVVRGRNHAPQDLEQAVDGVPGVRTGCVAAVGHLADEGEQVLLFVEARDPRPDLATDCIAAVRGAAGIAPDLVMVLEPGTLPRTSSGKIRRAETLTRYRSNTLTPPKDLTPVYVAGALAASWIGHARARWGST